MNKSLFAILIIIILAAVLYFTSNTILPTNKIVCTQEAFICQDGSSVGRTGPNCEFSPCPTIIDKPKVKKGKFCGGFAGVKCPKGYGCQLDSNYPDAGGTCVQTGGDYRK